MSGVQIDVRSNIDEVVATVKALPDRLKERAILRSINRAVDAIATNSSREIRKVYNLKHGDILRALTKNKASMTTLRGNVTFKGSRIPLILFDAKWNRGYPIGATAKIFVGGKRTPYKGAFIGTLAGTPQVLVRKGKERVPIKSLRGISIPLAMRNKVINDAIRKVASDTFTKNFRQQMKFLTTDRPLGIAYG